MSITSERDHLDPAEEHRLQVLDRYDILGMPPNPSLSRIAQAAAALSDSDVGLVSLVDRDQLVFKAGADELPCKTLPRKSSLCDAAIQVNARFEVPDVKADSRFQIYWQRDHPLSGRVVSYAGVPLRAPEGTVLGMLCVIGSQTRQLDASQWNALEVLADSAMSVLESRSQAVHSLRNLGAMIDSLTSEFLLLDADSLSVLYANAGVARRLGCETDELVGRGIDTLYPPDAQQLIAQARHTLPADSDSTVPFECKPLRADGSIGHVKGSIQLRSWQGRRALVITTNDVSELALERDGRAVAEAASVAKSEFVARISHELRTPLNAVLGFSQLLSEGGDPLTMFQKMQVDSIRQAGSHLLALIGDMLDISRIEAGRLGVVLETVPICASLDEAIELVHGLADASDVRIEIGYQDQPEAYAWSDPVRLRQVLLNLLTNALKYNRRGGSVRVEVAGNRKQIELRLIDTGLGMTAEQLAHLFEPFNRLGREQSGIQGTGIGLALAQQLTELMGGRIHVESTVGQGTTVCLVLPSSASRQLVAPPPATAPVVLARDPEGTVVYIEDNAINLMLVEQYVARWPKLRLERALTGLEGLELMRRLQPDLVLLDMHLPDFTGMQLLQLISADTSIRHQRVVIVSADAMPGEVELATAAGALEYWTKPLDLDRFGADLRRLLAPP